MYDLVIIGAGPAGLTTSIYASCFKLKHLVVAETIGGQLLLAPDILNYPGFTNIAGKELADKMLTQAKMRGGEFLADRVVAITKNIDQTGFLVKDMSANVYETRAVVLASGTERRKLQVPGEMEYTGKGVHYCATCEKQDFDDKICAVVGGANSAVGAAVELAQAAQKVYILYRGSELRGDPVWLEQITNHPKITVLYNTVIIEITGDGERLTSIKLLTNGANSSELKVDKLFIEIGGVPGTALVTQLGVKMDPGGYIQVNERLESSVPGIFAAGDLVTHEYSIEQISTAVGLGARAGASVFAYLKKIKAPSVWGSSQIPR